MRARSGAEDRRPAVVLLRVGAWHGYEDCQTLELYNCCFSSELLRRELSWTREDPLLGYLLWTGPYAVAARETLAFRLPDEAFAERMGHLDALAALWHCPRSEYRGDILGRLSLLLGQLGRAAGQAAEQTIRGGGWRAAASGGQPGDETARGQPRRAVDAYRRRRGAAPGPGYLVRLFKAATGLPLMAYLAQVRAERAAVLLLHSDEPITCIGCAVGWSDQNYFARRFKAHYGLSATSYRKRFATEVIHMNSTRLDA